MADKAQTPPAEAGSDTFATHVYGMPRAEWDAYGVTPTVLRLDTRGDTVTVDAGRLESEPFERVGGVPFTLSPFARRALAGELPAKVTR